MGSLSTAVRAFLTRRLEPTTLISYSLLIALTLAVVVATAMLVAGQVRGL